MVCRLIDDISKINNYTPGFFESALNLATALALDLVAGSIEEYQNMYLDVLLNGQASPLEQVELVPESLSKRSTVDSNQLSSHSWIEKVWMLFKL